MYNPVIGDLLEVRVVSFWPLAPTQLGETVSHWKVLNVVAGGVTQTDIAVHWDTAINTFYKNLMSSGAIYRGVSVQRIAPLPRVAFEFTIANLAPGNGSPQALPTQTRGLLQLRTALAGRPFRGRQYFPFPSTTGLAAATALPTAGYIANVNAIAALMQTAMIVAVGLAQTTLAPVIWHRKGYGKPPTNIGGVDIVTNAAAVQAWATQRRSGSLGRPNGTTPF
jgi:hypothetical protein